MKKTAFIIHGSFGGPDENWFCYLKEKLQKEGIETYVPKFPTPEKQSLDNWMKVIEKYKDKINENTILIGHSLGVAFILTLLEKYKADSAFLVSGFLGKLENEKFDIVNKTFTCRQFNYEKILKNCKKFYIFHSDNDPYIKLEKPQEIADKLNIKIIIVKGAGHFNLSSGYNKFELLFEKIKEVMDES